MATENINMNGKNGNKPSQTAYDVAVIGGGPGGYVCAIKCAMLGLKTVIFERENVGGTCLNKGCIPTKALLHSAEMFHDFITDAKKNGISASDVAMDYSVALSRKNDIVKKLTGGIGGLFRAHGVELVRGEASVEQAGKVLCGGVEYATKNIVIASGSKPQVPPISGAQNSGVITSDEFLNLSLIPENTVIIGGGVIGVEFASIIASLGKKATIIEMLPRILNEADEEISAVLTAKLERMGVKIYCGAKLSEIGKNLECTIQNSSGSMNIECDCVVMAVGRGPVTDGLDAQKLGMRMSGKFIEVDDNMRTNIPGIYAIGDVTGKIQLAHVASAQGLVAADSIAGKSAKMNYDIVPSCIYTSPEIAWVGLSEQKAKQAGIDYSIGKYSTMVNGKCMTMDASDGFCKLVVKKDTGEILGAQIVAPRATDMIAQIATAMSCEGTVDEIANTIHPHPTVSEIVMEAAHDVHSMCVHSPPKR